MSAPSTSSPSTSGAINPVVCIGECMVELARAPDGHYGLKYGGDTFNTAVYAARCGVPVRYATALGDDPYSSAIVALAKEEGIGTDTMLTIQGRMPGLYIIETDPKGERSFWYWRERAAARDLFEAQGNARVADAIMHASIVYLSGITLSLYSDPVLTKLFEVLTAARKRGVKVAFDSNYRSRGWQGDTPRARAIFNRFLARTDIALPTFDDEKLLFGDPDPRVTLERLQSHGVNEIAIKLGADGALVRSGGETVTVPCPTKIKPVDTTAAGDSFNGAFIASRILGAGAPAAALAGHRLAGHVIQHRGAIIPR